jgi:hypothetical protein
MTGKRRRKGRTRKGDPEQPDWLALTSDLLEPIAQRSRDIIAGVTPFRSVCRTWRAAVGEAPRLLLPAPESGAAPPPVPVQSTRLSSPCLAGGRSSSMLLTRPAISRT